MLLRSEPFPANGLESFRNTEVGGFLLLPAIGAAQCTRASASQGAGLAPGVYVGEVSGNSSR